MTDNSQRQKGRSRAIRALNAAITGLDVAKQAASGTPANPVFAPVAALLIMIRVGSLPVRDEIFEAHT